MGFEFIFSQISAGSSALIDLVSNGQARFLSLDQNVETDSSGFPVFSTSPRTTEFHPCVWKVKIVEEQERAGQLRGKSLYELSFPIRSDDNPLTVRESDKCELKAKFDGMIESTKTCEVRAIAVNGLIQTVLVIDISI